MIYQIIWPLMRNFLLMINTFAKELNDDFKKVNDWTFQWNMSFNPDLSKQAQKVIFSRKSKRPTHPPLVFNNDKVSQIFLQKHLSAISDFKWTFEDDLNIVLAKINKAVDPLRKPLITKDNANYYMQRLFDWTIVMSCTIKPSIICLKKNWNLFNITHA